MKQKTSEFSCKVDRPWCRGFSQHGEYAQASVATPLGLVDVYTQQGESIKPCTVLTMIHAGRIHSRTINGKSFSRRGCVTQAARFAADVAAGSA